MATVGSVLGRRLLLLLVAVAGFVVVFLVFRLAEDGVASTPPNRGERPAPTGTVPGADEVSAGGGGHQHHGEALGPPPALSAEEQAALRVQLDAATAAMPGPTVGDALAAGYAVVNDVESANDVHLVHWGLLGDGRGFDPAAPRQLLVSSRDPDGVVLAAVYIVADEADQPPEGFAGEADRWHRHSGSSCRMAPGTIAPADEAGCRSAGGAWEPFDLWMLHVWLVPELGNPDGVFATYNPCVEDRPTCPATSPLP